MPFIHTDVRKSSVLIYFGHRTVLINVTLHGNCSSSMKRCEQFADKVSEVRFQRISDLRGDRTGTWADFTLQLQIQQGVDTVTATLPVVETVRSV
jgi:hypothetical protein